MRQTKVNFKNSPVRIKQQSPNVAKVKHMQFVNKNMNSIMRNTYASNWKEVADQAGATSQKYTTIYGGPTQG